VISLFAPAGWCLLGTLRPNRSSAPVTAALFVIGLSGVLCISYEIGRSGEPGAARTSSVTAGRISSQGTVLASKKFARGGTALVHTGTGRAVLKFWGAPGIAPGDRVRYSGYAEPLRRAAAPGGFDEFLYWRARGAEFAVDVGEIERIGTAAGFPRWRTLLGARISENLPPRTAGYLLAALTGTRDESLTSLHRAAGTSHLLAVSGAHVGIAFAVFWFFLRRFRLRLLLISPLIWAYVLLSGAAPSAVRAAIMIQLVIAGRVAGRAGKPFNTVSAAGALMLLYNPWLFWDVGWRLSMIAVLTLSSLAALRAGWSALFFMASPTVWLTTSLQSALVFGGSPVVGILANFFALPMFSVLFPLALAFGLPQLAGLPFGGAAAAVPEFLFLRWERLSGNLLALCPWEVGFSVPLFAAGAAVMAYLFAAASGFAPARRAIAAVIVTAGLTCILI
jgi:competence protein ComEC